MLTPRVPERFDTAPTTSQPGRSSRASRSAPIASSVSLSEITCHPSVSNAEMTACTQLRADCVERWPKYGARTRRRATDDVRRREFCSPLQCEHPGVAWASTDQRDGATAARGSAQPRYAALAGEGMRCRGQLS